MAASTDSSTVIHADPEHGALRTAILLILAACLLALFFLLRMLIQQFAPGSIADYSFVLACAAAIPLALAVAWAIEEWLKRTWHSGNKLTLSAETVTLEQVASPAVPNPRPQTFDRRQRINFTNWTFPLKGYPRYGREKRLSDKWVCIASEFQQEDNRATVFSYMPPKEAVKWLEGEGISAEGFYHLPLADLYKEAGRSRRAAARPDIPTSFLHEKTARYWLAEERRWKRGLEISPQDFESLMTFLQANQPTGDPV